MLTESSSTAGESGSFAPADVMTRATFVAALGRLHGVDTAAYPETSFSDVKAGTYYAPYVEWASSIGLVNGYGDGTFGAKKEITVEQAIVMLARYARYINIETESEIELTQPDADKVSDWALADMKWAIESGVYVPAAKLDPQTPATRGLLAKLIFNLSSIINAE